MKIFLFTLQLLVISLPASSQEVSIAVLKQHEELMARQEKIDQFVWKAPLFLKDFIMKNVKSLGVLQHENIEKIPNQYIPGDVLEYRTLTFDGLVIYGRIVEKGTKLQPITITITKDIWKLRDGLNIGVAVGRIREILGSPMEISHHIWKYQGESEQVNFHIKGSTITLIELIYYDE